MKPSVNQIYATTCSLGPYHPAIYDREQHQTWYWPDLHFVDEQEAFHYAAKHLKEATDAAQVIIDTWNISTIKA